MMGTVRQLAAEVERGLREAHPTLRKTVITKVALVVGAMLEARTPNTVELAHRRPLDTERQDLREQWRRRLLKNPLLSGAALLEPWVRHALAAAGRNGQTVVLSLDQTDLGERFAVLMRGLVVGDRALPRAWAVEAGPANLGFDRQRTLLEYVRDGLPAGVEVLLLADRFYPSTALLEWLHRQGWHDRLRLKSNLSVDPGFGDIVTTGDLATGYTERGVPDGRLFGGGVPTNLGILHEVGHPEPWIIAMDGVPTRAAVRDYGRRWSIEPMFSDFKSRGFDLEATPLRAPDRLDRLLVIMALAMHGCVRVGQEEARERPSPLEKKRKRRRIRTLGPLESSPAAPSLGLSAVFDCSGDDCKCNNPYPPSIASARR